MERVAVLGAGAWGTAIACTLSSRLEVALWARDRAQAEQISASRKNDRYLPGIALPAAVQVTSQLEPAVSKAGLVLAATPVAGLRELLESLPAAQPLVWLCKGFEEGSGSLPHQIAEQTLGRSARCGALSGPSFAQEVARGLPCALTLASRDAAFAREAAGLLQDRKSTRLNSSHSQISYAVFCLKKKKKTEMVILHLKKKKNKKK